MEGLQHGCLCQARDVNKYCFPRCICLETHHQREGQTPPYCDQNQGVWGQRSDLDQEHGCGAAQPLRRSCMHGKH